MEHLRSVLFCQRPPLAHLDHTAIFIFLYWRAPCRSHSHPFFLYSSLGTGPYERGEGGRNQRCRVQYPLPVCVCVQKVRRRIEARRREEEGEETRAGKVQKEKVKTVGYKRRRWP